MGPSLILNLKALLQFGVSKVLRGVSFLDASDHFTHTRRITESFDSFDSLKLRSSIKFFFA